MREKLIKLLEHDDCPIFMVFGDSVGCLADYLIANGVRLEEKQVTSDKTSEENKRWISVTERLPQELISVLVTIPSEHPLPMVKEAYLANGCWATRIAIFPMEDITHWMPLPEPPKEAT